jgi:hypothetical protein
MMMRTTYHASAALLLIAGCTTPDDDTGSIREAHLAGAVSALQGAVASCAAQRAACENTDGAATAAADCNESFASCRAAAQADTAPNLDRAVNECAETSRTCREAATGVEAKAACTEQLKSCVGEDRPLQPGRADASADHGSAAPVADCITALRTCIEGDTPARACTGALRACVMAAVGNSWGRDGGNPEDLGNSGDAGRPEHPDSGRMDGERPDAGRANGEHPAAEAGTPAAADPGMSAAAMACKTAYDQCLASGQSKDTCARMIKDCRE